jgi:hypothetical protein
MINCKLHHHNALIELVHQEKVQDQRANKPNVQQYRILRRLYQQLEVLNVHVPTEQRDEEDYLTNKADYHG